MLKSERIKFKARQIIEGREVDFIVGKLAIEVNGHEQDAEKNQMLVKKGYTPIHFDNKEVYQDRLKILKLIKELSCQ